MMQTTKNIAALLSVAANAMNIKQVTAVPAQLSQTAVAADTETGHWNDDCHCEDRYRCPPALERCPGVYQLPGACESILDRAPLCYCNKGKMHSDWDHNISVDDEKACDNCRCDGH